MGLAHIAATDQPDSDVWHCQPPRSQPVLQPVAKDVSSTPQRRKSRFAPPHMTGRAEMTPQGNRVRLTVAQAIVRWLMNQFIEIDGTEVRICGGGFGIFGHGNVPCLGEALYPVRDEMPLYRGQNEQSMGFAAAAYAKYHLRRRLM
jgi:hypothetical protein